MHPDMEKILFNEEQLQTRVNELGAQITADYQGRGNPLTLVSILRGSYIFTADLSRAIGLPVGVDFMCVSSYHDKTISSGQVQITKDLSDPIEGKDIIVVEDILDTGNTLHYLMNILSARRPASIRICTLLDKPERRNEDINIAADYCGFSINDPEAFVVGYGLDYNEKYRNLSSIWILKRSIYGEE